MQESIPLDIPVIMCPAKGNGVGIRTPIAETASLRGSVHCASCTGRTHCDRFNEVNPLTAKVQ